MKKTVWIIALLFFITITAGSVDDCPWLRTRLTSSVPEAPHVELPIYLASFRDPVFGSIITRISGEPGEAIPNTNRYWSRRTRSIYQSKQAWSADEKFISLHFGGPLLLDGETYEVIRAASPPVIGTWHPVMPDVMIYVSGSDVREWNARTNVDRTLLTLPEYMDLIQLSSVDHISGNGEIMGSTARRRSDGKVVGLTIDLKAGRLIGKALAFAEHGFERDEYEYHILMPSIDGKFMVMKARGAAPPLNPRGNSATIFDLKGNEVGRHWEFPHTPGHGDIVSLADGASALVGRSDDGWPDEPYFNRTVYWLLPSGPLKIANGTVNATDHTSGRALRRPGWAFGGDFGNDSAIHAYKLDGSGRIETICHTRHARGQAIDYWAQTQPIPSPSGTRVLFATNWGTGPNYGDEDAKSFIADFRPHIFNVTPWLESDIGNNRIPGGSSVSNDTWILTNAGADIWGIKDAFRYVYKAVQGDCCISARVTNLTNTNPWSKAGVMIRGSDDPSAMHAMTCITPGNGTAFQRRISNNAVSRHTAGPKDKVPEWVRIERLGSRLISSVSKDGVAWTEIGRETIRMPGQVNIGLVLTSHHSGVVASAAFTDVFVVHMGNSNN